MRLRSACFIAHILPAAFAFFSASSAYSAFQRSNAEYAESAEHGYGLFLSPLPFNVVIVTVYAPRPRGSHDVATMRKVPVSLGV